MKRIIQLILFLTLILISFIFHKLYFQETNKINIQTNIFTNESSASTSNNLIKDLKYEVKLDNNNEYILTAEFGEIVYEDDAEKVKMQNVVGILIDQNNIPITIKSANAVYDNSSYATNFSENVKIEYLDNKIFADKVDLDFKNNIIIVYDNVKYYRIDGNMKADSIIINLITKKIDVNMKNKKDNIKIIVE
jgi:hypothetical protein